MDAIQEAKKLFNETWDLLDKQDRTAEENALMLHKAHTSCFLWRSANNSVNNARGEWQVSRVYSVLGYGQPALLHAIRSLDICLENSIGDFDLAFGYEAVARAYSVTGDQEKMKEYKELAVSACDNISEDGDKSYALSEVNGIGK
jgi:hypothetical protein